MSRPPASILMWAAIVIGKRADCIRSDTIARTRRESQRLYDESWEPEYRKQERKRVRFARVVVSMEGKSP